MNTMILASSMLPEGIGPLAESSDNLYWFIFWQCLFWFTIVTVGTVWFAWKYHQKGKIELTSPVDHNNTLEITWSVIPTISIFFIFIWGFILYMGHFTPTDEPTYDITVKAKKWSWTFIYPNGASSTELVIPPDKRIKFVMTSEDALHSFFLPNYRSKMDVIPGRYTVIYLPPTPAPDPKLHPNGKILDLYCTEYCGDRHSRMTTFARIVNQEDFDAFLEYSSGPERDPEKIWKKYGCNGCHNITGNAGGIGPTWKGLHTRGDFIYFSESIDYPNKVVNPPYAPGIMPVIKVDEQEKRTLWNWIQNDFKVEEK